MRLLEATSKTMAAEAQGKWIRPKPGFEYRVPEIGVRTLEFPNPEFEQRIPELRDWILSSRT